MKAKLQECAGNGVKILTRCREILTKNPPKDAIHGAFVEPGVNRLNEGSLP